MDLLLSGTSICFNRSIQADNINIRITIVFSRNTCRSDSIRRLINFVEEHDSIGPRQPNLVLIAYASSEGSGEPAHPRSLARTFAARIGDKYQIRLTRSNSSFPLQELPLPVLHLVHLNCCDQSLLTRTSITL